ncbi:MAG: hypothetical protein ACD_49C00066G0018 [uncultured bacterium (gcode 4)]|uniref:Uncharacterized protein n=1 Tax=uncultured bacterium (gcode 4) TaxID=1234023 RepID=K2BV38_9BACT|nr:MAG: hypothetical protein ACD_49C00066G0018 [uncultured bacterium (gcode 4)]
MTTVKLEIPNSINKSIWLSDTQNIINIVDLFEKLWIDLRFLLKERAYQKKFLKDLKENNFTESNNF